MAHKQAGKVPMGKVVRYNGATKDYDAYLDRQYIGSRQTHRAAENLLNELAFETLRKAA